MNNRLPNYIGTLIGLLILSALFVSCRKESDTLPKPSSFTKKQQENLGDLIHIAITANTLEFPILNNIPPYDTTAYWFVEKLYSQIAYTIQEDIHSTESNRWDNDRQWRVSIIMRDDLQSAFTIPGGNFYITTGLLKNLQKEYELAYIMAFELSLMNEGYLLNNLVNEFNTTVLNEAANHSPSANDPLIEEIANYISLAHFPQDDVKEIDEWTANLICESSAFDRTGILPLLDRWDDNVEWLISRSYSGRMDNILQINPTNEDRCGDYTTNGNYQYYILDRL